MDRKIIIFGNGLGMALDSDYFLLENALKYIWNKDKFLSKTQKELILNCIQSKNIPKDENELEKLHIAVNACNTLNNFSSDNMHWLSDDGKTFELLGVVKNTVSQHNTGAIIKDFVVDNINKPIRFLRVTAKSQGKCPSWHKGAGEPCWLFADEIWVE